MQQKNREKLTKKYSPVKALRAFGHLLSVKLPDIVHEIGRDEARHGKAFQGLLDRYFK